MTDPFLGRLLFGALLHMTVAGSVLEPLRDPLAGRLLLRALLYVLGDLDVPLCLASRHHTISETSIYGGQQALSTSGAIRRAA